MISGVVYSSISFLVLLVIMPILTGNIICAHLQGVFFENGAYRFISGLFGCLAVWSIIAIPFMLMMPTRPFHELRYTYIIVMVAICTAGVYIRAENKIKNNRNIVVVGKDKIYIIVFLGVVCLQLFETMYYAPAGYVQDDLYYYAFINDSVYTDQLFSNMKELGSIDVSSWRLVVAPWYTFLAFVAATCNIETLILCRTVMPLFLLSVTYLTIYVVGRYCFRGDNSRIIIFMLAAAIILGILSYSYYLFFLTIFISTWGKPVAGMIGIPMLFTTYMELMRSHFTLSEHSLSNGKWTRRISAVDSYILSIEMGIHNSNNRCCWDQCFLLTVLSAGTASLSFASFFSATVGFFFLFIINVLQRQNRRVFSYTIAIAMPFMIQFVVYYAIVHF